MIGSRACSIIWASVVGFRIAESATATNAAATSGRGRGGQPCPDRGSDATAVGVAEKARIRAEFITTGTVVGAMVWRLAAFRQPKWRSSLDVPPARWRGPSAAGTGTYKDVISPHISDPVRDRSCCNRGYARSDSELRSGCSMSFHVAFATSSTAASNTASAVWTYLDVMLCALRPIRVVAMAASL